MPLGRIQPAGVGRRLLRQPAGAVGLGLTAGVVLVAGLADRVSPRDPFLLGSPALLAPSPAHPMGTDNLGRDMFTAVVHGLRTSMEVTVWVTVLAAAIGIAVGSVSGYRGGAVDTVLMKVTEVFQSVPRFFLALLVLGLFGPGLDHLILVLGLTSWTLLARVVRAEALSVREREFVEAARALGASGPRILWRHVVPNVLPAAAVVVSLGASRVVLLEAGLAFLGLGDPTRISLGFLINNAQRYLDQAWWMSIFPGATIVVAVVGINLLSDGLADVLNPLGGPLLRPLGPARTGGRRARRRARPPVG